MDRMNPIHCQSCGCTPKPGEWSLNKLLYRLLMITNKDAEELEKMLTKLKDTGSVGTEVTVQDFKAIRLLN